MQDPILIEDRNRDVNILNKCDESEDVAQNLNKTVGHLENKNTINTHERDTGYVVNSIIGNSEMDKCNDTDYIHNNNHNLVNSPFIKNDQNKNCRGTRKKLIIDSDSEIEELRNLTPKINNKSRILAICDSESSEDDFSNNEDQQNVIGKRNSIVEFNNRSSFKLLNLISSKNEGNNYGETDRIVKEDSNKTMNNLIQQCDNNDLGKKLTGKAALTLRKEIRSESQRMIRESSINLPYHKPKANSLKEFLQNRQRFTATSPAPTITTPPAVAIKMSYQQLKDVSEKMAEREKEVEQFFKSEDESGDEDYKDAVDSAYSAVQRSPAKDYENNERSSINKQDGAQNPSIIVLQNILLNSNISCTKSERDILSQELERKELDNLSLNICESKPAMLQENPGAQEEETTIEQPTKESSFIIKHNDTNDGIKDTELHLGNIIEEPHYVKNNTQSNENRKCTNKNAIDTPDFEFTLDDSCFGEEEIEDADAVKLNKIIKKYATSNHNLNKPTDKVAFKPLLKAEQIVDLNSGPTKLNEINQLMNRFIKHTEKKTHKKQKVKLEIVNFSDGKIHKETVELPACDKEPISINEKPGEQLKRLHDVLKTQMAQKRSKIWQQKLQEDIDKKNNFCENEKFADNINLDNEDEEELTESEEDILSAEEDILNDHGDNEESTKHKIFFDEEAEENDIDSSDESLLNTEEANIGEIYHQDFDGDDETDHPIIDNTEIQKKRKLKRIIKAFCDDSDDEENEVAKSVSPQVKDDGTKPDTDKNSLDSTDTWDENIDITPHQKRTLGTPIRKQQTQSNPDLAFLTPIVQLTGLQSLNSGSKFLRESPISPFVISGNSSPPKCLSQSGPQKRLFLETDVGSTQELNEVAALCSGKFTSPSQTTECNMQLDNDNASCKIDKAANDNDGTRSKVSSGQKDPSTQDLLKLSSGKFTGMTQVSEINSEHADNIKCVFSDIDSNKLSLNLMEISTSNTEIRNFGTDDKLISQLLDEEELQNFKKKFNSPKNDTVLLKPFQKVIDDSSEDEQIISSSKKKKMQRKLIFSDDDDSDSSDKQQNGKNNEEIDENGIDQYVEYDSEENEIDVAGKNDKLHIEDFLENEAELSESDWESADEDEKDLDEFEEEDGDNEKIDESKLKSDLERIHIRRVLDDDDQEVKILQELLLDDGELHGIGRERQFRWKNIDAMGHPTHTPQQDDEVYLDDDENEERWRKLRYERDFFLKKQLEKAQNLTEDKLPINSSNSQILKLGQAAMIRCSSVSQNTLQEKRITSSGVHIKEQAVLLDKKGSFLTRSDQILARVGEFTKGIGSNSSDAKKSTNFLFQTVTGSEDIVCLSKKRKVTGDIPATLKKLRLNNLSPIVQKKQMNK